MQTQKATGKQSINKVINLNPEYYGQNNIIPNKFILIILIINLLILITCLTLHACKLTAINHMSGEMQNLQNHIQTIEILINK